MHSARGLAGVWDAIYSSYFTSAVCVCVCVYALFVTGPFSANPVVTLLLPASRLCNHGPLFDVDDDWTR